MRFTRLLYAITALIMIAAAIPYGAAARAESIVSVTPFCDETSEVGLRIEVGVTVGRPAAALQAIEFTLSYDPEKMRPVIASNAEGEMDAFIVNIPDGWEQLCSLSEAEHKYYLRFAALDNDGETVSANGDLALSIPFDVIGSGRSFFTCDSADIVAVPEADSTSFLGGTGGSAVIAAYSEREKFAITLAGGETAESGKDYALDIRFTNLGDVFGIIAAEFELLYDKSVFAPKIASNADSDMDVIMAEMPGEWEQLCSVYPEEGRFVLRFASVSAGGNPDELVADDSGFLIRLVFTVIGEEGAAAEFTVPSDTALALNNRCEVLFGCGDEISSYVTGRIQEVHERYELAFTEGGLLLNVPELTEPEQLASQVGASLLTAPGGGAITGYVFTGCVITVGDTSYTVVVRGDCSGNGTVDAADYMMTKRTVLGTYSPDETRLAAMCLKSSGRPQSVDYIMLKRHVLKTYDINFK
ncbi:MAG: hypothetical protein J5793_01960 [Clostridia bacterium]|nr:hypothetical protein [Clostridia bacterium]